MQARVVIRSEFNVNLETTHTLTITVFNDDFTHEICIPNLECANYPEWMKFVNERGNVRFYGDGYIVHMIWVSNRIRVVYKSSCGCNDNTQSVEFNSEPLVTLLKQAIEELHWDKSI